MSTNPPQNSTSAEEAAPGGARREKLQDDHTAAVAAATVARTPSTNKTTSIKPQGGGETEEQIFSQALQELKDLRYQFLSAARQCESAFLENKEKRRMVLESTKRYVCVAIVAVVDHLGSLSSKLEKRILDDGEIVETQHKMDCLKQRLLTCQQYAVSVEFSGLRCSNNSPRHHHYYAYPCPLIPVDGKPSELSRNKTSDLDKSDSPKKIDQFVLAVHCPVDNDVICGVPSTDSPTKSDTSVLVHGVPILGNSSLPFEPFQSVFGSKHEDNYFVGIGDEKKKERMQANRFLSFLRVNRIRI